MMTGTTKLTRIEQSIDIDCDAERVFEVLIDPNYIPEYAAGIEGAVIIEDAEEGMAGAKIEMVTKGGNILHATVLTVDPPRRIVIEDERGVRSTWEVVPTAEGKVRLMNTLEGPVAPAKAQRLAYDADVKFQALAATLAKK